MIASESSRGEAQVPLPPIESWELVRLFEESGEGILILDSQDRCTYASPTMGALLGCEPQSLIGFSLTQALPFDLSRELLQVQEQARNAGGLPRWQLALPSQPHLLEVACLPTTQERTILRFQRLEERIEPDTPSPFSPGWQALADDERGWEWDLETGEANFSSRWKKQFLAPGQTLEPEIEAWYARIHPEDRRRVREALLTHLEGASRRFRVRYRFRYDDSVYRWVQDRGMAIRNEGEMPRRVIGVTTDVTRQRALEDQLVNSQLFVRQAASLLPDILYIYDLEKEAILYTNRKLSTLLGYQSDEWRQLGTNPFRRLLHPQDLSQFEPGNPTFTALLKGEPVLLEYRLRRQGGDWHWFQAREALLTSNEDGAPSRVIGVMQSIQERKAAELELRRSEERLQLALDGASVGTWDWDVPADKLIVNSGWREMLGLPSEERVDSSEFWNRYLHPDDLSVARTRLEEHLAGITDRSECELRLRHREGHYLWTLARGKVVTWSEQGKPLRMVGANVDITARKEIEQQLQQTREFNERITRMTPDIIYILDFEAKRCVFVSPCVEAVMGYTAEEIVGLGDRLLEEVFAPGELPDLAAKQQKLAHAGEKVLESTYRLRQKFGGWRWLHCREMTFLKRPDGTPGQCLGIALDITEQKQLEQQRERLLESALQRADEDPLTGLFNHRAYHAFLRLWNSQPERTPLTVAVLDVDNFKFFNDAFGHVEGDAVLRKVAQALQTVCGEGAILARLGGDEFAALLPGTDRETAEKHFTRELTGLLAAEGYRPHGSEHPVPVTISCGVVTIPDEAENLHAAFLMADSRLLANKRGQTLGLEPMREALAGVISGFPLLDGLVSAVDVKDRYTRRHSEDVLLYALMIAEECGWREPRRSHLQVAALLHDVGKIGIPDRLLRLPARLTDEEYQIIKQHAPLGAVLVSAVLALDEVTEAVRHHHEAWDGSGYPDGLRGEAIPEIARLLAVADAFSALTTDRPYRKGLRREAALDVLEAGAGKQWDSRFINIFVGIIRNP